MHNCVPDDHVDENIYTVNIINPNFNAQLKLEERNDAIIRSAILDVDNGVPVREGQLKRVAKQLRIEHGILTKYGRPILPPSLRHLVISEMHKLGHYGIEKLYNLLTQRFYWPKMHRYLSYHVSQCTVCNQSKIDSTTPKSPLVPICEPQAPLEFICIDIAHLPTTTNGFKYILLFGDIFSKYIEAASMRDQNATTVVTMLWNKWITRHGCPLNILSDQGANVDGDTKGNM